MELSELLESLSFLESSSSVLLFDRFGLGGLLGAESPAALGLLAGMGGRLVSEVYEGKEESLLNESSTLRKREELLDEFKSDSSCVLLQEVNRGSSPSRLQPLPPPTGSSPELRYTREMDLGCLSKDFLLDCGVVRLVKFVLW